MKSYLVMCIGMSLASISGTMLFWLSTTADFEPGITRLYEPITIIAIVLVVIAIALAAVSLALQPKPGGEPLAPAKNDRPVSDPSKTLGYVMGRAIIKEPIVIYYQEMGADPIFADDGGK